MDLVESLHSLGAELKKAKFTVEEAKVGLKMVQLLHNLGIKEEDYKDVIQACTKAKSEGYIADAVKLNKLENATGMTHGELLDQYTSTHEKLKKEQKDLETTTAKYHAEKEELANIDKQKKAASQGLKAYMDQTGVDMNRLKLVEGLAKALKDAGISNKELGEYIARQQVLNKAGISLNTFTAIVEKAKALTSHDQGKELLKSMSDYGGLVEAIKALQAEAALLQKQTEGLEKQAQLKGKLDAQLAELKAEKASLESGLAELHKKKNELDHIQTQIGSLTKKMDELEQESANLEAHNQQLIKDIQSKEERVSDLGDLQTKHDAVAAALTEMEARLEWEKRRLEILESFIGLVQSAPSSLAELEKFATMLPGLIDQAKQGKYSPNILKAHVLGELTGGALQVLKCHSCGAKFSVDKPATAFGYHCPCCGLSSQVITDKEGLAILKEALATVKPQVIGAQLVAKHPKPNPPHGDKGAG